VCCVSNGWTRWRGRKRASLPSSRARFCVTQVLFEANNSMVRCFFCENCVCCKVAHRECVCARVMLPMSSATWRWPVWLPARALGPAVLLGAGSACWMYASVRYGWKRRAIRKARHVEDVRADETDGRGIMCKATGTSQCAAPLAHSQAVGSATKHGLVVRKVWTRSLDEAPAVADVSFCEQDGSLNLQLKHVRSPRRCAVVHGVCVVDTVTWIGAISLVNPISCRTV
jgi:hypothetical protein